MDGLKAAYSSAVFSYKGLLTWIEPRNYIGMKFIVPLLQMAFFAYVAKNAGGDEAMSYAVVGNMVQLCAVQSVLGMSMAVGMERYFGTLPLLLVTPTNRFALFMGRSTVYVLDGVTSMLVGLVYAVFLFGVDFSQADPLLLVVIFVVTSFSLSGFGLLIGSLSLYTREVVAVANASYFALLIVCGVNFPVTELPYVLQLISKALPLTYGIEATRNVVLGASFQDVQLLIGAEILFMALLIFVGYFFFEYFEQKAKKKGTFELI
ncbi:MAG: ABC transporter permease [Candidatus Methanofastidiosia archaeon]|jgi:ABC-2 type transport system permease protein